MTVLAGGTACEVCGRPPHPRRLRLALAKLAAVFPVELLLHALVVSLHLGYALTVTILSVSTTVLVIWVVEPSAMRMLGRWLHAPARQARRQVETAPALWRIRTTLDDEPGALERLTHELAVLDANILGLHVHPLEGGAMDEIVVSTPDTVTGAEVHRAVAAAGGRDVHVWPTSALALVDGQTKALALAARVASDPAELPLAVAELLGARVVTERLATIDPGRAQTWPASTRLRIPSPWSGLFLFDRPDEPFTPAESARAHRLAEVAEAAVAAGVRRRSTASSRRATGPGSAVPR